MPEGPWNLEDRPEGDDFERVTIARASDPSAADPLKFPGKQRRQNRKRAEARIAMDDLKQTTAAAGITMGDPGRYLSACNDIAKVRAMHIREFVEADWPQVWPIVRDVVQALETFPFDPAMTATQAYGIWIELPPGRTVVAVDGDRVLGTAKMGTNRPGPGSHVATASFMVAAEARGRGVGTALCRFALDWARESGYAGMQFNAVVESNRSAVELYQRLGFYIVGTVPGAFAHPVLGRVGLHIMYCAL
jgi:GNAT superfamily N-acetyltransferase